MGSIVGSIHQHDMPAEYYAAAGDVWRCDCGSEFFKAQGINTWLPVTKADVVTYNE